MHPIELRSDNCAGVAPEILAALAAADTGSALAYGGDQHTAALREQVRELLDAPEAEVFPVVSGTAANSIGLSAICPPWGSVLCHETAHILRNEGGATSMFGGGIQMVGLPGDDFKLQPDSVERGFRSITWGDPHHPQPSVVSLTCPTDFGTVYTPEEVAAITAAAVPHRVRVHLDGARLANALVATGSTAADLVTRAGVSVLSLGATKGGALSTDAIVSLDPAASEQLVYRTKRAGHVASKMRYQSAQLQAYLSEGLWLRLAERANAAMQVLAEGLRGLGVKFVNEPQANMLFAMIDSHTAHDLAASGVLFYEITPEMVRFVTSWQTTDDDAREAVRRMAPVLSR